MLTTQLEAGPVLFSTQNESTPLLQCRVTQPKLTPAGVALPWLYQIGEKYLVMEKDSRKETALHLFVIQKE